MKVTPVVRFFTRRDWRHAAGRRKGVRSLFVSFLKESISWKYISNLCEYDGLVVVYPTLGVDTSIEICHPACCCYGIWGVSLRLHSSNQDDGRH